MNTIVDRLTTQLASTTVKEKEKEVSFAGKSLKLDNEEDAKEIVDAIKATEGMTTLNLEGNTIGIPGAKAIAKVLESQSSFKRALWKDMFTRRTEKEIPQALSYLSSGIMLANAHLVELNLSDNAFGPRGLHGIVKLLESPSCYTLQELHLNNNGLGISGGLMLSNAICNCINNSRKDGKPFSLKVFVCGRNRLENEGAAAISKFLKQLNTLESLAMPQNGIYPPGIREIADAISRNPNIKVVNLEDNSLTEEGAKHIAKSLSFLGKLEMLNLGDCIIRNKGALSIANSLKNNCPQLRELYLGFNEIQKEGGIAIIEAIKNKTELETLVLNGNQFGDEGCDIIKEKMAYFKKADQLATLSEDEGELDDDDDDDDDKKDEEEDDIEEDIDNNPEIKKGDSLNVSGDSVPQTQNNSKISIEEFFANPTIENLLLLDNSKINSLPEEAPISYYLELFTKISFLVKPDDEKLKSIALKYTDLVLTKAFAFCTPENSSHFNNDFLVSLGLLKGEDKKMKQAIDITGALILLEHAVRQEYFSNSTRNLLQFFLSRPLIYVTACGKTKHMLMKALYQM